MLYLLIYILLGLWLFKSYLRRKRIIIDDEVSEKPIINDKKNLKKNFYDKYIDTYIKEKYGEGCIWEIPDTDFLWQTAIDVPLQVVNSEGEKIGLVISKANLVFAYEKANKKPKSTPKPKKNDVVSEWVRKNLSKINIKVSKELMTGKKTQIEYPCNISYKYREKLLDVLCEITEFDFCYKGKNILVVDFKEKKKMLLGEA